MFNPIRAATISFIALTLLLTNVRSGCGDQIQVTDVSGKKTSRVEVVEIIGVNLKIRHSNGTTEIVPLATYDRESLLRIIVANEVNRSSSTSIPKAHSNRGTAAPTGEYLRVLSGLTFDSNTERVPDSKKETSSPRRESSKSSKVSSTAKYASYLQRYDANKDGVLQKAEWLKNPYIEDTFDRDKNGKITLEELTEGFHQRRLASERAKAARARQEALEASKPKPSKYERYPSVTIDRLETFPKEYERKDIQIEAEFDGISDGLFKTSTLRVFGSKKDEVIAFTFFDKKGKLFTNSIVLKTDKKNSRMLFELDSGDKIIIYGSVDLLNQPEKPYIFVDEIKRR